MGCKGLRRSRRLSVRLLPPWGESLGRDVATIQLVGGVIPPLGMGTVLPSEWDWTSPLSSCHHQRRWWPASCKVVEVGASATSRICQFELWVTLKMSTCLPGEVVWSVLWQLNVPFVSIAWRRVEKDGWELFPESRRIWTFYWIEWLAGHHFHLKSPLNIHSRCCRHHQFDWESHAPLVGLEGRRKEEKQKRRELRSKFGCEWCLTRYAPRS